MVAAPTDTISEAEMQRVSEVEQWDLSSGKGLGGCSLNYEWFLQYSL